MNRIMPPLILTGAALEADMTKYKAAIEDFDKVLQYNPDNIEATFNRARLKEQVRDFKGALADYDKCIELFPYFTEAYYDRSELKKEMNDFKGSQKDFDTGKMYSEMNRSKSSTQLAHDSIALAHLTALTADFSDADSKQQDTMSIELLPIYYIAIKDSSFKTNANCRPLLLKTSKLIYPDLCLTNKELHIGDATQDSSFSTGNEDKKVANDPFEVLLHNALKKTSMQMFNDAVKDYDKIVSLYPSSAIAYFARGVNACREVELLNQFDEAPAFLNQKKRLPKIKRMKYSKSTV